MPLLFLLSLGATGDLPQWEFNPRHGFKNPLFGQPYSFLFLCFYTILFILSIETSIALRTVAKTWQRHGDETNGKTSPSQNPLAYHD
jgi:hypothetical protein